MPLNRIFIHIDNGIPTVYMERPYESMVIVALTSAEIDEPVIRLVDAQTTSQMRAEKPDLYKKVMGVIGQG